MKYVFLFIAAVAGAAGIQYAFTKPFDPNPTPEEYALFATVPFDPERICLYGREKDGTAYMQFIQDEWVREKWTVESGQLVKRYPPPQLPPPIGSKVYDADGDLIQERTGNESP